MNPSDTLIALDRADGEADLRRFVRLAWPLVEPNVFRPAWHIDIVCEHLTAVSTGQIRDLVICQPPGTTKSLLASTLWGAWDWIKHPTRRWICSTYAQKLSNKNARLQRDLIMSAWYQARWGDKVRIGKKDVDQVELFKLESQGWRMSTGVEGVATGWHGDHILGDDLVNALDAEGRAVVDPVAIEKANNFWFKVLHTRRADPVTTARVLIAQRLHHEDTTGRAIDAGYEALVLPMEYDPRRSCVTVLGPVDPRTEPGELLCPDRFPREVVDNDREVMGAQAFSAQQQQDPTPLEGLLFKSAGRLDRRHEGRAPTGARTIITCDAAFKDTKGSDFVSVQVWAVSGAEFYLLDNDTRRLSFGATCRALEDMAAKWPEATGIYVEDKANGPAIIDTLRGTLSGIQPWDPGSSSKLSRAEATAPLFESGHVWIPGDGVPWVAAYLSELKKFPLTKHDDQVDGTTMALLILHKPKHRRLADAYAKMAGRS